MAVATPNPIPDTLVLLILSFKQKEPMVRPIVEFRITPTIQRTEPA